MGRGLGKGMGKMGGGLGGDFYWGEKRGSVGGMYLVIC